MGSSAVHWGFAEAYEVPADDGWLTPREREVLARMRVPKRRGDWRLGRWTAKLAVAGYLGGGTTRSGALDPASIEIRARADGSPEAWLGSTLAPVDLSLSHAGGAALCALGDRGVWLGCDIERVESRGEVFAADFFTAAELALVRRAPADARFGLETLLWSAKESCLKALRDGLRRDTRSVVVEFDAGKAEEVFGVGASGRPPTWAPLLVSCQDIGGLFRGWWSARDGRVLTLVAAPPAEFPRRLWPGEAVHRPAVDSASGPSGSSRRTRG